MPHSGGRVSARLPDFPWDQLAPYKTRAAGHPGGLVDLSMGTPVDPVPPLVQAALADAADAPGYPTTAGTPELRAAISTYLTDRFGVPEAAAVLPTIGSKELVAGLPGQLGLGAGDLVVIPEVAYPTYAVGARLAGAQCLAADSLTALGPRRVSLLWLNSPANPTGKILPVTHLRKVVAWARERGVIVASDECYLELGGAEQPVSILHPDVSDGDFTGLLAVHSLSKRSNLAGYRAGFVAGDPALVRELLAVRKHAGLIVPTPVQAAMTAALRDTAHVDAQRQRYDRRRELLRGALLAAGFGIEHSQAGLYLWATRDEDCWQTVEFLARRGILVSPGAFYGPAGARHVRVALTAADTQIAAATERLAG
ncbi:aminotransferase [Actinocatenispora thailandica]|uniref:Aminotransferase n=1 Tax=Actinocatenispora thailandica TaxID=227318 RepID=A0A7R7DTR0_9ACTN|nr:succinyldiaminopimelate transaminase [Actinocatenispora thailandica]BCJ37648.1 aminotransferase [Actinocatenispora thailandica]